MSRKNHRFATALMVFEWSDNILPLTSPKKVVLPKPALLNSLAKDSSVNI